MMPASGGLRPPGTCERRQPMLDGSYHIQSASHRPLRVAGGQPPGMPARPGRAWRVGAAPAARARPSPVRNPEEPADDRRGLHPWRWSPMTASPAATRLVIVIAAGSRRPPGPPARVRFGAPLACRQHRDGGERRPLAAEHGPGQAPEEGYYIPAAPRSAEILP